MNCINTKIKKNITILEFLSDNILTSLFSKSVRQRIALEDIVLNLQSQYVKLLIKICFFSFYEKNTSCLIRRVFYDKYIVITARLTFFLHNLHHFSNQIKLNAKASQEIAKIIH